jgi:hypothetical protein
MRRYTAIHHALQLASGQAQEGALPGNRSHGFVQLAARVS